MKKQEMINHLTQTFETLKQELIQLQESFNSKKEQFIKIQGALEVLQVLDNDEKSEQLEE